MRVSSRRRNHNRRLELVFNSKNHQPMTTTTIGADYQIYNINVRTTFFYDLLCPT